MSMGCYVYVYEDEDEDEDDNGEDKYLVKPYLEDAFLNDDPQELISIVKLNEESAGSIINANSPNMMRVAKLTQLDIFRGVIATDAVRCATAFLEGKTCISVDINDAIDDRADPLNEAAFALSYDLVDLFLRHGADPDFKSGRYELQLPVEAAVESCIDILHINDRTSTESINNLFTALCQTQMKKPLEMVRLLARGTKNFRKVFKNYAKEGKLGQMIVLLIVAKDHIMPQSSSQRNNGSNVNGSMRIRENIIQEMRSLSAAQRKLSIAYGQRSELVQKCKAKRVALMSALNLLDLFEKAGDAIGLYFQSQPINVSKEKVTKDIAAMVEKAGCALKDIDLRNIVCKSSEIKDAARSLNELFHWVEFLKNRQNNA